MSNGNWSQTQPISILNRAVSRALSGRRPDDEEEFSAYESSLEKYWEIVENAYNAGWCIESLCDVTNKTSELRAHNRIGMCDIFAFVLIEEGRLIRITSPCGKNEVVGPFIPPTKPKPH